MISSRTTDANANLDAVLLEGRSPLVAGQYQFTPTGYARFDASEKVTMYFEIYDPALLTETSTFRIGAPTQAALQRGSAEAS